MKDCKFIRVLTAILTLISAVALLCIAALLTLFFVGSIQLEFVRNLAVGISYTVAKTPLLNSLNELTGQLVFVAISVALPSLLLMIAAPIEFSKPKKSAGKYIFACLCVALSTVILTLVFEFFGKDVFGENVSTAKILIVAISAVETLFAVVCAICLHLENKTSDGYSHKKKKEKIVEETAVENIEQTPIEEQEEQPVVAEQTLATEYVPMDIATISDIVDDTYGNNGTVQNVNMKKIDAVRALFDAGVITKDEYIALVDAYLKDKN